MKNEKKRNHLSNSEHSLQDPLQDRIMLKGDRRRAGDPRNIAEVSPRNEKEFLEQLRLQGSWANCSGNVKLRTRRAGERRPEASAQNENANAIEYEPAQAEQDALESYDIAEVSSNESEGDHDLVSAMGGLNLGQ